MDWEYPGVASRGSIPAHKAAFTKLVHALYSAFKQEEEPLLLTAAVAAGRQIIDQAYEIAEIAEVASSRGRRRKGLGVYRV